MTKKKVLIISSSLRPDSNSHALCEQVAKGVEAAGGGEVHEVHAGGLQPRQEDCRVRQ